jgi:hypothetical protein
MDPFPVNAKKLPKFIANVKKLPKFPLTLNPSPFLYQHTYIYLRTFYERLIKEWYI